MRCTSRKWRQFLILSMLLIAGRLFDITTTYRYTPDLRHESNLVVQLFGAGWPAVFALQTVLVALVLAGLYFYCCRYRPVFPREKTLSFRAFISFLNFGDTNGFARIFYKAPASRSLFYAFTGYIVSMTLLCTSFIVGTSTALLLLSSSYRQWYGQGVSVLLYMVIPVLATFFSWRFYAIAYRQYRCSGSCESNERTVDDA